MKVSHLFLLVLFVSSSCVSQKKFNKVNLLLNNSSIQDLRCSWKNYESSNSTFLYEINEEIKGDIFLGKKLDKFVTSIETDKTIWFYQKINRNITLVMIQGDPEYYCIQVLPGDILVIDPKYAAAHMRWLLGDWVKSSNERRWVFSLIVFFYYTPVLPNPHSFLWDASRSST